MSVSTRRNREGALDGSTVTTVHVHLSSVEVVDGQPTPGHGFAHGWARTGDPWCRISRRQVLALEVMGNPAEAVPGGMQRQWMPPALDGERFVTRYSSTCPVSNE